MKTYLTVSFMCFCILISGCTNLTTSKELSNKMYWCKSGHYDEEIHIKVNEILNKQKEKALSYLAFKEDGAYYLIVNYPSESIIFSAINKGYFLRHESSEEGNELLKSIIGTDYSKLNNDYKENFPNNNCSFVRFNDSENQYDFEFLNSRGRKNSPENKIYLAVRNILTHEIVNELNNENKRYIQFRDLNLNDFNIEENKELAEKMDDDVFFELSKHFGNEKCLIKD